jgi:hypothetical protein
VIRIAVHGELESLAVAALAIMASHGVTGGDWFTLLISQEKVGVEGRDKRPVYKHFDCLIIRKDEVNVSWY